MPLFKISWTASEFQPLPTFYSCTCASCFWLWKLLPWKNIVFEVMSGDLIRRSLLYIVCWKLHYGFLTSLILIPVHEMVLFHVASYWRVGCSCLIKGNCKQLMLWITTADKLITLYKAGCHCWLILLLWTCVSYFCEFSTLHFRKISMYFLKQLISMKQVEHTVQGVSAALIVMAISTQYSVVLYSL